MLDNVAFLLGTANAVFMLDNVTFLLDLANGYCKFWR